MNKTVVVNQIDGSWCKVRKEDRLLFEKCLEYDLDVWVPEKVINVQTGKNRTIKKSHQKQPQF